MTKRILAFALIAVTALGLFSGCASKNDKAEKGAPKKYIIATDTTFAPFEFENEKGEFVGIDMDLLKAIAEDQGFEYDLQVLGFNAALQAVQSKQADGMIAGMSITDERKQTFDFSEPYFDSGVVMAVKADNETVKSYEDLKGQKVAVKTATEGFKFASDNQEKYGYELVVFEDSSNMYEEVKSGNSVACFEDYPVVGYAISQGVGLKMVTEKEQGSPYGFAVCKGSNPELIEKFDAGLANLKKSGKYQEILDTYIKK